MTKLELYTEAYSYLFRYCPNKGRVRKKNHNHKIEQNTDLEKWSRAITPDRTLHLIWLAGFFIRNGHDVYLSYKLNRNHILDLWVPSLNIGFIIPGESNHGDTYLLVKHTRKRFGRLLCQRFKDSKVYISHSYWRPVPQNTYWLSPETIERKWK